jgi:hypothetical protein
MILTHDQIQELTINYGPTLDYAEVDAIMKEVERLTREETRDDICNRLDDWVHAVVYPEAGE